MIFESIQHSLGHSFLGYQYQPKLITFQSSNLRRELVC